MQSHKLTINDWAALPTEDARNYEQECLAAAVNFGRAFRSPEGGPHMQTVVENSPSQYIDEILWPVRQMAPWLLEGRWAEVLKHNDSSGEPLTARVAGTGMELSPTTARYAKHIAQLFWLFGPMKGLRVAEIGGGYGGLCSLFMRIFQPASYTLYDIDGGLAVQQRYLEELGVTEGVKYSSFIEPADCDLVISVAALCELHPPVIDKFAEAIISRSRCGYLVWSRPVEGLESPEEIKRWLKTCGHSATAGCDDFLFRQVCTLPLWGTSVYYWRNTDG